jgi:hypothetical protein
VPHPPHGRTYDEREIEVRPFPLEVGVQTEICAVLDNKGAWPQTVKVEFSMADFTMGVPFTPIASPSNPRTVTLPPYSTVRTCLSWMPLTPGHKCFQIRISQDGYEDIISQKNLDVGEHLRPGIEDELLITVGNPKSFTADIQVIVYTECEGWDAWVEPDIVQDVPPGGTRQVTLHVVPPAAGAVLGSGCYIDVESYVNGELIGGIRKIDLPPVHPPVDEPPYAEREMTMDPDPPVVGQPGQICAELHNYAVTAQTVDLTLYAADFGMGLPFQEAGQINDVVIPGNTTIKRCLTWTPPPGSVHRCLQIRIQQDGYEDIISQRNIDLEEPLKPQVGGKEWTFGVGNPTGETKTVQLDVKVVGLPPEWDVDLGWDEAELEPGEVLSNTLSVESPSQASAQGYSLAPAGDVQSLAVECFIDDKLLGGVLFEFRPDEAYVFLPMIIKRAAP